MHPAHSPHSGPPQDRGNPGERLSTQERRLRLLLLHLAGRAVRARVEPEDLLQEVYLRALAHPRGLPDFEPGEGPLFAILASTARHVVVDAARAIRAAKRAGRTERLQRSDWSRAGSGPPAPGAGPVTAALGAETSRALAECFLALPGEYRRVIGLRQFEGLSARQTAERMGRSETAVHSLYRRALAAWEQALPPGARDESGPKRRLDAR
jgi:RNA polymerase sigma-70 factor (ECF subfamily)